MMDGPPVGPVTFVRRVHPERRLLIALLAVSFVCVGLWWSGALAARLTATMALVEADPAAGRGTLRVEIRNDGRLPVEVRGLRVDDRGGPPVEVGPVPIEGRRLAGGDAIRLDVAYAVDCVRPGGYGADPELGVRVRGPLGVTQTRPVRTVRADAFGDDDGGDSGPLLCPFPYVKPPEP